MSLLKKIAIALGIGAVSGAAIWGISAFRVSRNAVFKFGLPNSIRVVGRYVNFNLPVFITNTVNNALFVKWLRFNLVAGGTYLGNAVINEPFEVLPLATVKTELAMQVDSFQLLSLLPRAVAGIIEVSYDGQANISGVRIPVSETSTINVKALLNRA